MSAARRGHARATPEDFAPVFSALGDATRLQLLDKLAHGDALSIAALADGSPLTRQAITKHLRILEASGVVRSSRVGRESQFSFAPEAIAPARDYLDAVSAQWDAALGRLKAFVEKND